jgi:hypothetical protein
VLGACGGEVEAECDGLGWPRCQGACVHVNRYPLDGVGRAQEICVAACDTEGLCPRGTSAQHPPFSSTSRGGADINTATCSCFPDSWKGAYYMPAK